jgi:hypothetical protein
MMVYFLAIVLGGLLRLLHPLTEMHDG